MLIAALPASQAKARKDLAQAGFLLRALAEDRPCELEAAWQELLGRGPAWRQMAERGNRRFPGIFARSCRSREIPLPNRGEQITPGKTEPPERTTTTRSPFRIRPSRPGRSNLPGRRFSVAGGRDCRRGPCQDPVFTAALSGPVAEILTCRVGAAVCISPVAGLRTCRCGTSTGAKVANWGSALAECRMTPQGIFRLPSVRQAVGRDTGKTSAGSLIEHSPVPCIRRSSLCCLSDGFGFFPRSFPLASAIAMPSRVRILTRSASNSAKAATI